MKGFSLRQLPLIRSVIPIYFTMGSSLIDFIAVLDRLAPPIIYTVWMYMNTLLLLILLLFRDAVLLQLI